MRRHAQALLAVAILIVGGCKATLDTQTTSDVTLTATPDPSSAAASSGVLYKITDDTDQHEYHWRTSFSVGLAETEGVGLAITSVSVKVQQAAGGIVVVPTNGTEHYQFTSSASGNRVESHGSASVGFDVLYDLPNGGREALATVTFTFYDDNNVSFTKSVAVRVQ